MLHLLNTLIILYIGNKKEWLDFWANLGAAVKAVGCVDTNDGSHTHKHTEYRESYVLLETLFKHSILINFLGFKLHFKMFHHFLTLLLTNKSINHFFSS